MRKLVSAQAGRRDDAGRRGAHLLCDLGLLVRGERRKLIVLGADQDRDRRLGGGERQQGQRSSAAAMPVELQRRWPTDIVEAARLAPPLLDAVERALAREVKGKEDGDGVVAADRQHADKLSLATQIPDLDRPPELIRSSARSQARELTSEWTDREGDLGVADRDGLFHEVDAWHGGDAGQTGSLTPAPAYSPSVWM